MIQFMCYYSICHQRIGTSISALAWPEHEINITRILKSYKIVGGSDMNMYYYYCPSCSCFIYNKPDLLEEMAYIPAGSLAEQIEFKPTAELWSDKRPNWMQKAPSIIKSFNDNGTLEKLQELLENLDQRQ